MINVWQRLTYFCGGGIDGTLAASGLSEIGSELPAPEVLGVPVRRALPSPESEALGPSDERERT